MLTILPFGHIRQSHFEELQELFKEYPWLKWDGSMSFGISTTTTLTPSLTSYTHYAEVFEQYENFILHEYHANSIGKLDEFIAQCSKINTPSMTSTSLVKRRIRGKSSPPSYLSSDAIETASSHASMMQNDEIETSASTQISQKISSDVSLRRRTPMKQVIRSGITKSMPFGRNHKLETRDIYIHYACGVEVGKEKRLRNNYVMIV